MKKDVSHDRGSSYFYRVLGTVLLLEIASLTFFRVPVSTPPPPPPPALRVALAPAPPPPPKPPAPKTKAKPKVVRKMAVSHPVTPPALPAQAAASTNLLAANVGTAVNMSWGEESSSSGGGAGYLPPRLLSKVDTESLYTEKMKANDEEGDVVIDLFIDASGKILRWKMMVPSVWDDMNRISENVLKTLKFSPATQDGRPIPGKFELNFRFRIRNTG